MHTKRRPLEILLVEDNPGDVRLTLEALNGWLTPPRLSVAANGIRALEILNHRGSDAALPDIILLDLNLPTLSGREVLRRIKDSPLLRHIPVIIISSSDAEDDVRAAYDLQANCYLVKPVALDRFMEMVQGIEEFWSRRARLPGTTVT